MKYHSPHTVCPLPYAHPHHPIPDFLSPNLLISLISGPWLISQAIHFCSWSIYHNRAIFPSTPENQVHHWCSAHMKGLPHLLFFKANLEWHHPYDRKWRRTKEPPDESERGEWKSWLKSQHLENKDHGIQSHHFMGNRWQNSGNSGWLYFGGLQNHCRWWLQSWN